MVLSFKIESSIRLVNDHVSGSLFYNNCEAVDFEKIEENDWAIKYNVSCFFRSDISEKNIIKKVSQEIRDRISSLFIILSKSDVIVSDEIEIKTEKISECFVLRSGLSQRKKIISIFTVDINKSNLVSLGELEWNFLIRYSKSFVSISEQEKIHNVLQTIDIGGKIEYCVNNVREFNDKSGERMNFFMKKIGILEEIRKQIISLRGNKAHENKYVDLPDKFSLENIRDLIYPEAERIMGLKGFDLGINIGDNFNLIFE
jgi:hypothetical protein